MQLLYQQMYAFSSLYLIVDAFVLSFSAFTATSHCLSFFAEGG